MSTTTAIRRFSGMVRAHGFSTALKALITTATVINAHAGRTNTLALVGGFTTTLPAAKGTGNKYRFLVKTTLTSGTYVIKVANSTDVFTGGVMLNDVGDTAAATADFAPTASTSDTFTMTFSLGSGKAGDWVEFEDYAAGFFNVTGMIQGVTDPTTPFSATV